MEGNHMFSTTTPMLVVNGDRRGGQLFLLFSRFISVCLPLEPRISGEAFKIAMGIFRIVVSFSSPAQNWKGCLDLA
jgi:hypothetical protein